MNRGGIMVTIAGGIVLSVMSGLRFCHERVLDWVQDRLNESILEVEGAIELRVRSAAIFKQPQT